VDGKMMLYALRQLMREDSDSAFLDDLTSYQYLNEAAADLAFMSKALRTYQEITTVADQQEYDVNADYMGLYLKNSSKEFYLKLNDGTSDFFLTLKAYEELIYGNQTTSVAIPNHFSIIDASLASQITGTATSDGAASGGECTLTDTAGVFTTTDKVSPGDIVHNTTDVSMGVVLSVTSAMALVTALFNGSNDDWTSADAYVIQPQGRYQLLFEPPPSTASYTATLFYLQRPAPVYSDYGMFRFPSHYISALVMRAAWIYKYRDQTPNFGDKWFVMSEQKFRKYASQSDDILRRKNIGVNMKARGKRW